MFVVCVLISWSHVICTVLQARSYTTGILVRSIDPNIRRSLLERLKVAEGKRGTGGAVLKEFTKMSETAPSEQTVLASLKGSGFVVVPTLTSRNSCVRYLPQTSTHGLRRAAFSYFFTHQEFRYQVKLAKNIHILRTYVKVNGKVWKTRQMVSFIYEGAYRLGLVMEYIIVRFWPANEGADTEVLEGRNTTFVKLWPLAESGVTAIYGYGDGFTTFRVRRTSNQNQQPIYIHSDSLSTLYCVVPDAALDEDYSWCVPIALAFAD